MSALTPSERRELEREGMRQSRLQERRDAQLRADVRPYAAAISDRIKQRGEARSS